MNHAPAPNSVPADGALITTVIAIVNAIWGVLPAVVTVVAGLMSIAWYVYLFYCAFKGKKPPQDD